MKNSIKFFSVSTVLILIVSVSSFANTAKYKVNSKKTEIKKNLTALPCNSSNYLEAGKPCDDLKNNVNELDNKIGTFTENTDAEYKKNVIAQQNAAQAAYTNCLVDEAKKKDSMLNKAVKVGGIVSGVLTGIGAVIKITKNLKYHEDPTNTQDEWITPDDWEYDLDY